MSRYILISIKFLYWQIFSKAFILKKLLRRTFNLYFHHDWKNALKLQKSSSLQDAASCYGRKFVSSDNPSQNIWHKPKKCSKTGQDFNNAISNFASFLTAIVKL